MFEMIKKAMKEVIVKLFNRKDVKNKLGIDIGVSDLMASHIDLWGRIYKNNPPWKSDKVKSLNLGASVASELGRLVTLEFESSIADEFLNKEYQFFIKSIRDYCESGCAYGGVVFKPFISDDGISIDVIYADNFFPTAYDAKGTITGAVFVDRIIKGKRIYTKLEHHDLLGSTYNISNFCFEKKEDESEDILGKQVTLGTVSEWEDIEQEITLENIEKPLFSYFKIPGVNNVDQGSPLGVSCFVKATELIKEADKQYSRILWEYEGTELAIEADASMFKKDFNGKPILPEGKERLYRTYNMQPGEKGKSNLTPFSPEIRDNPLSNGLNNLLKRIEFLCGLSYGTISDPSAIEKTATEILSSKQRLYSTVKDIQKALQESLEKLIYAMGVWSSLSGFSINPNIETSFNWDDSIVIDKETELASMRLDVSSNLLRPEFYIAKRYGVTIDEALQMMPDTEESLKEGLPVSRR